MVTLRKTVEKLPRLTPAELSDRDERGKTQGNKAAFLRAARGTVSKVEAGRLRKLIEQLSGRVLTTLACALLLEASIGLLCAAEGEPTYVPVGPGLWTYTKRTYYVTSQSATWFYRKIDGVILESVEAPPNTKLEISPFRTKDEIDVIYRGLSRSFPATLFGTNPTFPSKFIWHESRPAVSDAKTPTTPRRAEPLPNPSMERAVRMYPSALDNASPLGRAVNAEIDWINLHDRARFNDPEGFEKLVKQCALRLGIKPVESTQPLSFYRGKTPVAPATPQRAQAAHTEGADMVQEGGVLKVPVQINGAITLKFVVDSGASDVQIPKDVFLTLIRAETIKESDFLPGKTFVLADGSKVKSDRFILRSIKVGEATFTDVEASVGGLDASLLLGQSFLSRFDEWKIDNKKSKLILTK